MSKLEEIIKKDLLMNKKEKRTVTVNVDEEQIDKLDKIAKQFSIINNGKNFSRKYLVHMAIEGYIEEATRILKSNFNVNLTDEEQLNIVDESDLVLYPREHRRF